MVQTMLDDIVNLAKRRGFAYPSQELYGGLGAVYDFGPLGTMLKNNIRAAFIKRFAINGSVLTKRSQKLKTTSTSWRKQSNST